jgi:hypothetical protein
MKPRLEVADIFRLHGPAYRKRFEDRMPLRHKRVMRAIEICRTAQLGGHVDQCETCGHQRISYNSCRNRHCPKCQFLKTERWIEARKGDLLPIPYFHVVFTLPEELRSTALANQRVIYGLLFQAASQSLLELARDEKYLGATIGMTAVLHTWSQTLVHHPHVHGIVTGGGLTSDGTWQAARKGFFLPVRVVSRMYRGKFLAKLKAAERSGELRSPLEPGLIRRLYTKEWTVYCKRPFRDAEHVVAYLGRYTHRIAISNQRLIQCDEATVRFRYRDSGDHDRQKTMALNAQEFIRRFLLHVLPDGFVKIRHYGLHGNRTRRSKIAHCRRLLLGVWTETRQKAKATWEDVLLRVLGVDVRLCPECGGQMARTEVLSVGRAPPATN